jgi:LCP family protein required for cell wall assembly
MLSRVDGILTAVMVIAMILRRKLFWVCATLAVVSIGAGIALNRVAYNFCASGELAANWLCNTNATQQVNVEILPTPPSAQAAGGAVVTRTVSPILPRPWNGKERVNILVMGIDQRQGEKDIAFRTDTMIVLTLDPVTLHAGMLSIPRDLWAPIPGYDNGRINTANFLGDAYDYPGGGPELARKTVEQTLGIPINFYARVNFTAFEEIIDQIGGISVDVPEDVYDPEYPTEDYGTQVFSINKGRQNLDGATALKFARTRHSLLNGDFDRARNQQLVLLAVKEKLTDPQNFLNLLSKAPQIISRLSSSMKTDMNFDQVQQLAALAQKVERRNIQSAVLDQTYTEMVTTLTNPPQQVQVPIRARIAELRDKFFTTAPNAAVETSTNTGASVVETPTTTP